MSKRLTSADIMSAKKVYFFNNDSLFAVFGPDEVYGYHEGGRGWYQKNNFWDYFESETMMTYFTSITKEEAVRVYEGWIYAQGSDKKRLDQAICFATKRHARQFRKGTARPYILHPLEAMQILADMNADTDLMIAGLLHDTMEDTGTTREEIRERFGEDVAALVAGHSEDKSKTWEERKTAAIEELAAADKRFQMLVLSDKLSNLRSIAADYAKLGDELWNRFNAPVCCQAWYYQSICQALTPMQNDADTAPFYEELTALCRSVFGE